MPVKKREGGQVMARYVRRSASVEAVQITDATFDAPHPNPEHVIGVVYDPVCRTVRLDDETGCIGDWIVTNTDGSIDLYFDNSFRALFERTLTGEEAEPQRTLPEPKKPRDFRTEAELEAWELGRE